MVGVAINASGSLSRPDLADYILEPARPSQLKVSVTVAVVTRNATLPGPWPLRFLVTIAVVTRNLRQTGPSRVKFLVTIAGPTKHALAFFLLPHFSLTAPAATPSARTSHRMPTPTLA